MSRNQEAVALDAGRARLRSKDRVAPVVVIDGRPADLSALDSDAVRRSNEAVPDRPLAPVRGILIGVAVGSILWLGLWRVVTWLL